MDIAVTTSPKYRNSYLCCTPTDANCSTPTSSSSTEESEYCTSAGTILDLNPTASAGEVRVAIAKCKDMVLNSAQCSTERARLVRRLIELRIRLEELKDEPDSPPTVDRCGHHFKMQNTVTKLPHCEHCGGNIWSAVQSWYLCEACSFAAHATCVKQVIRTCAHIILAEQGELNTVICPWIGLAAQDYKCHECNADLSQSRGHEARLCDYTGRFYCTGCHWGDVEPIPARVIHDWDWTAKPVCRASRQLLTLAQDKQFIDIEKANPRLFNFMAELGWVRNMRKTLFGMKRYLNACVEGVALVTAEFKRLSEGNSKFSMSELLAVKNGILEVELTELTEVARSHITNCARCSGRGYLCEICGNNEVLFPFDACAEACTSCNSLYHRACWLRKEKQCFKCLRIEKRKLNEDDNEDVNSYVEDDLDKWVNP